ncbi:MAG: MlaD family protein [Thermodesulfobacteriota bacterium]|nr:MlaD family protein [Thermodesulfobacteriota bacterium]
MAFKTGTEIKVGIFVFMALAALAYMSLQVGKGAFMGGEGYELTVFFDNVTGLKSASPVEIAGIEVGTVKAIELVKGRAKLTLLIHDDVRIRSDATASIKSRGVLGDKFVEIRGGSAAYPELADGAMIARSDRSADLEVLFEKVGQIADDIGLVAKSVANVFGGPEGERDMRRIFHSLRDLTVNVNELVQTNLNTINRIVANMDDFSGDLKDISGENKRGIKRIIENLEVASGEIKTTLTQMSDVFTKVNTGQGPMGKLVNDEDMGDDLKKTMASLQSTAEKIDEGKGTLGKLINEDTTARELDKALEGINKYLEKQDTFKTSVDFTSEYLAESGDTKSYLNLKLQPSEDKYYLVGIVDDPHGRTKKTETVTRTKVGNANWVETREEEEKTEKTGIKFNAQIAKRWSDFVLRGGLFESTGGAGADYYLWEDRVKLFFEAFDFDEDDPPHLKAGIKLYFLKNFYASAGFDDFASDTGDSSFFAGLGLFFTDEDLKYLFSDAPIPKE